MQMRLKRGSLRCPLIAAVPAPMPLTRPVVTSRIKRGKSCVLTRPTQWILSGVVFKMERSAVGPANALIAIQISEENVVGSQRELPGRANSNSRNGKGVAFRGLLNLFLLPPELCLRGSAALEGMIPSFSAVHSAPRAHPVCQWQWPRGAHAPLPPGSVFSPRRG